MSRMTRKLGLAAAALGLMVGMAGKVSAGTIAYDNASGISSGSLQNYTAGPIGMDFDVNAAIRITALGAFDNGSFANLDTNLGGVTVGIFDRNTGLLVGPSVTLTSTTSGLTQINGNAFISVTAFDLPVGFQGSIVSFNDQNFNSSGSANPYSIVNSGGGYISFVGQSRYDSTPGLYYPTIIDSSPENRYDAGTFIFATPEPSTILSAGIASLVVIGHGLRRRKAKLNA